MTIRRILLAWSRIVETPSLCVIVMEPWYLCNINGVEQLTRYLELLNRDPLLAPVQGVFAAQLIKPQARTLAEDRGIRCLTLDYDELRGIESDEFRLF